MALAPGRYLCLWVYAYIAAYPFLHTLCAPVVEIIFKGFIYIYYKLLVQSKGKRVDGTTQDSTGNQERRCEITMTKTKYLGIGDRGVLGYK